MYSGPPLNHIRKLSLTISRNAHRSLELGPKYSANRSQAERGQPVSRVRRDPGTGAGEILRAQRGTGSGGVSYWMLADAGIAGSTLPERVGVTQPTLQGPTVQSERRAAGA